MNTVSPYFVDNCFLYLQIATGGLPVRAPFDDDVSAGGLLDDNTLYVKVAVWLNDTGLPVHMEPTMVIVYRLEETAHARAADLLYDFFFFAAQYAFIRFACAFPLSCCECPSPF